jgi:hypothetical protein
VAVPNPANAPPASLSRYFDATPGTETVVRNGLTMDFVWIDRPHHGRFSSVNQTSWPGVRAHASHCAERRPQARVMSSAPNAQRPRTSDQAL